MTRKRGLGDATGGNATDGEMTATAMVGLRYRFHHDANDAGVGPLLKDVTLRNPIEGGFTSETDRPIVVEITKCIAQRYREYITSGSSAWAETIDMGSLPAWVMEAGRPGAIAEISTIPAHMTELEISEEISRRHDGVVDRNGGANEVEDDDAGCSCAVSFSSTYFE